MYSNISPTSTLLVLDLVSLVFLLLAVDMVKYREGLVVVWTPKREQ